MHGRFSFAVVSFSFLSLITAAAVAQQPQNPSQQTWFNSQAAEVAAAPQFGTPQAPHPYPAEMAPTVGHVDSQETAVSLDTDLLQQPSLDQQLAALGKRVELLEKPPIKYPSNVQVLGVFQVEGVAFNQDAANKLPISQGGVMQPAANQPPGGVTTIQDGADFRRARLAARAALANNINAFMQFDFAFPGRPTFTDVWVEYTDLPWLGTVRIGQWKQPFSLEVVSSFRYTTFMERSSLFQAFTPFRHIGVGAYNHADDLMGTWAASYIRTGQDQNAGSLSTRGGNGFTGRMTRLAWYDEEAGRSYLHLGADYYFNNPPQHSIAFRSIPEIFVGENRANGGVGSAGFQSPGVFDGTPFFANTGTIGLTAPAGSPATATAPVLGVHTYDFEALWVHGPLSVQSEAMGALVDPGGGVSSSFLHGEYVQVGWFLTGEHRPYDRIAGAIDRVRPFEDFFLARTADGLARGKGAWEVAVRYSHLDLNDTAISGGILNDVTFGVNWYTNPYSKLVFNYIHMWRQSPTTPPSTGVAGTASANGPLVAVKSEANAFGLMAQVDF
jgi:phosphate-selective porin OprO/OprP